MTDQVLTRDVALHLRNIAALIDAEVPPERFDNEVRTFLCIYGAAALRALTAEDALDDPRGAAALQRYRSTCPSCYYDLRIATGHAPNCELGS
jgi:hypothetical protein